MVHLPQTLVSHTASMRMAHVPSVLSVGSALDLERSVYVVKAKTGHVTRANRAAVAGDAMFAVDAACVRYLSPFRFIIVKFILIFCENILLIP